MKNTLKRLLSLLLVLSFVLAMAPAVYATEAAGEEGPAAQVETDEGNTAGTEAASAEAVAEPPIETATEPAAAAEEATEAATEPAAVTEPAEAAAEATEAATEPAEEATEPSDEVVVDDTITDEAQSAAQAGANMAAAGMVLVAQTTNDLAPGVSYEKVITRNSKNQQNIGYMTEIDLSQKVTLKAVYEGYYTAGSTAAGRAKAAKDLKWNFSTTTGLAADYASIADPAGTVVMATNGDYFNMGTGEPLGYLIMEGNVIKGYGEPYFAILKDGTAVIRDAGADHSDVVEAISGPFYLIKDGAIVVAKDADPMPRNSVGIRADGSVVFFQNDGRQAPTSVGMTLYEVASVLLDAGCVNALYLDGGGSATVAARHEGSDTLKVVNSPSDGAEREVSTAILVVSTAQATGIFDHVSISPKNELYTPGSKVQFTASGVDTAGAAVAIPADVQWALAEDSKDRGTIDANGLFTANDEVGKVTVVMTQNGKSVGSATIEIVIPDQIYFTNDEISLGFEDTTDFGLAVRYMNRDVNYKDGDIVWTTTNDKMGTFSGNIFTASDGESLNGEVTATSAHAPNVSGTIHVIVGMLPTIVWNFEDVVNEDGSITSAEEYYTNLLTHGNYGRGGKESIEIVSIDDDEPVRFGEKSLKLNYDFTQCGEVTEGAIVGTTESFEIPGTPTAIGVWVYAPEGVGITWGGDGTQAGFWLRGYVNNGSTPADYTLEPKAITEEMYQNGVQPGIYWEGWMYLEADLTNIQAPYSLYKGNTFRLMFVNGTKMGTRTANSIYFDNLQFVYGTNVDDIDNPKVDSIMAGTTELTNGSELTTNTITLRTTFSDVQNKYTSGVDASTVRMFIDGVNVVDNDKYSFALNANDGYAELYDLKLADGTHSVTVSLRDKFGNDVEETRYFTVKGGTAASPAVSVAPVEEIASLGGVVTLEIRASDSTVSNSATTVRLSNMFPDVSVVFSDNYTGTSAYNKKNYTVTIDAQRKADAAAEDDNLIAKIVVKVPPTLTENETFLYEVKSGSYSAGSAYYGTYSAPEAKLPVGAGIAVSSDPILVGGAKGVIKVTDLQGKGVANAGIYLASDNSLIGTTDDQGQWETDYFSAAAGKVAVYAKTEDGMLSFQYNVFTYDATGDASEVGTQVLFNAASDNSTEKSISWISNPLTPGAQSIRYRVKDGKGGKQWALVEADTELHTFVTGGNKAANINRVTLTGLTAGTTYEYQVGTSETWSAAATFTTGVNDGSTKFFVMADIQASDLTNVNAMIDIVKANGYEFGIQTGDAIDDVTNYGQISTAAQLLGAEKLGNIDMIRVLGNHEYYGDGNAARASALYNLSEAKPGSCYSVTYGDVYVAVVNFTNTDAELIAAMDWLKADAKASNATWKVLAMHQPPYYTNASGGNAPVYTYVPDACEEAGIDVVFSGHDHSLTRTNQLTDDEIDKENGILYYIGGSSGEKSYSISSQKDFDYEKIFALYTTEFGATYIGVTADKYKMVLDIYDVAADGSQEVVDTYTLMTSVGSCAEAGHQLEKASYADGKLTCNGCGEAVDPAEINYTGWATDKATGLKMLFIAGKAQIGETLYGEDVYYFDENGVAYDGKVTIDEVEFEFDDGLLIGGQTGFVKKADGKSYHYVNGQMTYGWYEQDGAWYHFDADTGVMNTGTHVKPDAEAISKNAYYDFGEDGKLLRAYFNPAGYYYWAGLPLGDAWVKNGADSDPDAWYRTNANGHYVTDRSSNPTVVIAVDGVEYTIDNKTGKLLKGSIVNKSGKLYYYWVGEPVNDGWFELEGNTYYAYEDGHLAVGSKTIDGKNYMFTADGVLVTKGIIITATLTEKCEQMVIKVANADEKLTDLRVAVWPVNAVDSMKWLEAEKDGEGMWTVTVPLCQFGLNNADVFAVHAYTGEEFLIDTTVEVPLAVTHAYTDDKDASCNICGELREIEPEDVPTVAMFRLYNPNTGEHFYTGSEEERDNLAKVGWNYEGVAWNAPIWGGTPMHRLFNPNTGDHHYTGSAEEIANLQEAGWQYEGIAWNSASADNIPQFRLYNPNAVSGIHHYTSSIEERENLVKEGWILEGIGWYGLLK